MYHLPCVANYEQRQIAIIAVCS